MRCGGHHLTFSTFFPTGGEREREKKKKMEEEKCGRGTAGDWLRFFLWQEKIRNNMQSWGYQDYVERAVKPPFFTS